MNDELAGMTFFLAAFLLSSALVIGGCHVRNRLVSRFLALLAVAPLVLLAIFRSSGTDTFSYYTEYTIFSPAAFLKSPWSDPIEILDKVVMLIAREMSSFTVYLAVYSILTLLFALGAIVHLVRPEARAYSWFLFLCMYYPVSLNTSRQMLAVAIVFWAVVSTCARHKIRGVLWILFASAFHITALVALPIPFLMKRGNEVRKWLVAVMVLVGVVVSYFIGPVLELMSRLTGEARYMSYGTYAGQSANLSVLVYALSVLAVAALHGPLKRVVSPIGLILALMIIGISFELWGYLSPFLKRAGTYYNVVLVLGLGSLSVAARERLGTVCLRGGVLLWGLLYFVVVYGFLGQGGVFPYSLVVWE